MISLVRAAWQEELRTPKFVGLSTDGFPLKEDPAMKNGARCYHMDTAKEYEYSSSDDKWYEVMESGGGSGGGFKVVFSFNDDDFSVTADKTYAEIKAAVEAGEFVYGVASVPGLGVGSVICGGYLEDGVIHFVSIGMEVTEDYEQRMVMIWFNCNPDGTFDFNLENPPYKNPLPYVDSSDNGKTLKVVDGKWMAVQS